LPLDQVHWYQNSTTQSLAMSHLSHSTMSNITRSATSNDSSSSSSSAASMVGVVPPAIPRSVEGAVGAAAFLRVHATQAAAIANAAANDAAAVSPAHGIILDKHCTIFLQRAFGINPDGTALDQAVLPDVLRSISPSRPLISIMIWSCASLTGEKMSILQLPLRKTWRHQEFTGSVCSTRRGTTVQSIFVLRRPNL
jgi:hypothetical protein